MGLFEKKKISGMILTGIVLNCSVVSYNVVGANNTLSELSSPDTSGALLRKLEGEDAKKLNLGWLLFVGVIGVIILSRIVYTKCREYKKRELESNINKAVQKVRCSVEKKAKRKLLENLRLIREERIKREKEQKGINNIKSKFDSLFETEENEGDKISLRSEHGRALNDLEKLGDEYVKGIFYMSEDEAKKFLAEGVDFSLENFFSKEELDAMRNNKDYINIDGMEVTRKVPPRKGWENIETDGEGKPLRVFSSEEKAYPGVDGDINAPFYNIFNEEGKIRFALLGVEDEESFDVELPDGNEEKIDRTKIEYTKEERENFEKIRNAEAGNVNIQKERSTDFDKTKISQKTFHFCVCIVGKVKDGIELTYGVPRYEIFDLNFSTKDLKNNKEAVFSFLDNSFKESEEIYGKDCDENLVIKGDQLYIKHKKKLCAVGEKYLAWKKKKEEEERKREDGVELNLWKGLLDVKDGSKLNSKNKYEKLEEMKKKGECKEGKLWSRKGRDKNYEFKEFDVNKKTDFDECYLAKS